MLTCSKCGATTEHNSNFCITCGARLEKAQASPTELPDKFKIIIAIGKGLWKFAKILLVVVWWILTQLWRLTKTYVYPALKKVYYRIPRRRTVMTILIGVVIIGGATPILISQFKSDSKSQATQGKSFVMKEPNQAAMAILSGTWVEQQAATREILSHVGFEAIEGNDYPKEGSWYTVPPEIALLSDDASRKAIGGRMTLVQFTQLLKEFGFPYEEGKDPVLLMQSAIRKWVIAAIEKPSAEGAEAPLFLQTMALNQLPAIDLTQEDWDPALYRLTYLEMEVFLGAFIYAAAPPPKITAKSSIIELILGTQTAYAADSPGSCSYAKQWFGQQGAKQGVGDLTQFNIELISALASELTGKGIEVLSEVVSKLMTPINAAMKLMKLSMLYWSLEVNIVPSIEQLHKPAPSEDGKDITFTAKVGVNEEKYKEYLEGWSASQAAKEIKDCLSFAGLPMPTDTGEIAADVENWSVEWDIVKGGGEHALIGLDKNEFDFKGQFQMKVKRKDKISGEAKLVTDLTKEKTTQHAGYEHSGYVVTRALVETSKPPGLGTLISGGKTGAGAADSGEFDLLGLSEALSDVLAGWYQEVAEPEAYGYTKVDYHTEQYPEYSYEGTVSVTHYYSEESNETTDKNHRGEYSVNYLSRQLSSRGSWNVRFILDHDEPAFAVYSTRPEENIGTLQLSENYVNRSKSYRYCISGNAPVNSNSIDTRMGSDSIESELSARMVRERNKSGEFTFRLSAADISSSSDVMVTLKGSTIREVSEDCSSLVSGTHYEEDETFEAPIDTSAFPLGLNYVMRSTEEYPKVISVSAVIEEYGAVSMWRLNLKRIDPVPEGKSK